MNVAVRDFPVDPPPPVLIIVEVVAEIFGISTETILCDGRRDNVVRPRHAAMYIAVNYFKHSTAHVARVMGRDHTTVMAGVKATERRLGYWPDLAGQIRQALQRLPNWQALALAPRPPKTQAAIARPAKKRSPPKEPPQPEGPAEMTVTEMCRLYDNGHGWSVRGLAKRYRMEPVDVASIVGSTWWAGPRDKIAEARL